VSAVSIAPNDERQLHAVAIDAATASGVSSPSIRGTGSLAPKRFQRVGANVMTARHAWLDTFASLIDQATLGESATPVDLTPVLLNGVQLFTVARARAATLYGCLADALDGSRVTVFDPERSPKGSLGSVSHELSADGAFTTRMDFASVWPAVDFYAFLPDHLRREILRMVPS
jgi:hypothetical protein